MIFAEKVQDDRQIPATILIVVYQQNFGFTPHLVYSSRG